MIPQTLSLLMTYKCNFVCDHCSVFAGPDCQEVMEAAHLRRIIEQAYAIPSIRVVAFTGGEPALYPDLLQFGISLAHEKGLITRLVTNAWWAETPEKARNFLQNLRTAGLNELNVSYDDFHRPYLEAFGGEQNVVNAVRAATELDMTVLVGVAFYPGAGVRTGYLRRVFQDVGIQQKVGFMEDFVFPLGRARQKLSARFFVSDPSEEHHDGHACRESGQTLAVLPDGKVLFCCGHIVNSPVQEIFTVGDLASGDSLSEIVARIQRNVFYWWLHREGPKAVLAELGVEEKFRRNCEACFYLGTAGREKLRTLAVRKEEIFSRWEGEKNGLPA